jgi:hypothetical protein
VRVPLPGIHLSAKPKGHNAGRAFWQNMRIDRPIAAPMQN